MNPNKHITERERADELVVVLPITDGPIVISRIIVVGILLGFGVPVFFSLLVFRGIAINALLCWGPVVHGALIALWFEKFVLHERLATSMKKGAIVGLGCGVCWFVVSALARAKGAPHHVVIPAVGLVLGDAVLAAVVHGLSCGMWRIRGGKRLVQEGTLCPKCGYRLIASVSEVCPECSYYAR